MGLTCRRCHCRRRRVAAAASRDPTCPRAALYIIPALPNVKNAAVFALVRATYIETVKKLAPAGAWQQGHVRDIEGEAREVLICVCCLAARPALFCVSVQPACAACLYHAAVAASSWSNTGSPLAGWGAHQPRCARMR